MSTQDSHIEWWQQLPKNWKDIFAVHVALLKKGVSYNDLLDKETLDPTSTDEGKEDTCFGLYEKVMGKAFESTEEVDLDIVLQIPFLWLYNLDLDSLEPLTALNNIRIIDCSDNNITDLSPLTNSEGLELLDCSGNPVHDLTPLANLTEIDSLECWGCDIKSLQPLENLVNLTWFDCSDNPIDSIRPVWEHELEVFICANTNIPAQEIEDYTAEHPECDFEFEEIEMDWDAPNLN